MRYRTGTLYDQKHAVRCKRSISPTCPLCPQLDSALHILSAHAASKLHVLSITLPNMSIPDVPFPALSSPLIRRRFQIEPVTLLIPIDLFSFPLVEFYGTRYQSGSFSLLNVGSTFSPPAKIFLFSLIAINQGCYLF